MFVRQILLLIVLASSSLEAGQLCADGDAGAKAEPSGEQHWLSLFIRACEAVERRDAPRFSSALCEQSTAEIIVHDGAYVSVWCKFC